MRQREATGMGARISASGLSPGLLKRLLRGRDGGDVVLPRTKSNSRITAWKDIPPSWGICKPHGMAWFPKEAGCATCSGMTGCLMCEGPR